MKALILGLTTCFLTTFSLAFSTPNTTLTTPTITTTSTSEPQNTTTSEPVQMFMRWYSEIPRDKISEPEDAALATLDNNNHPAVRFIKIRKVSDEGFLFFTQPGSPKVQHFSHNNYVSLAFNWPVNYPHDHRQVIVKGTVQKHALLFKETVNGKVIEWQGFLIKPDYFQFGNVDHTNKVSEWKLTHFTFKNNQWEKQISTYNIVQFFKNDAACKGSLDCLSKE